MDISSRNGCISSMLPYRQSSVPPSISLILHWRSTDENASRMTLERYDVGSCGESLIVHDLSLGRSPGVFTPLLFVCKLKILIENSECLGSTAISMRSGAFPNGGTTHRITQFRSRTSHASMVARPMLHCVSRVNGCSSVP